MESRTKFEISDKTIISLFEKAGIPGAENIAALGAGEYNSVYAVDAGGKAYAIKIAPRESARVLTYEKQMMEQEVYYYSLMKDRAGISVPRIFYSDFSGKVIPTNFFIMERLSGQQMDQVTLTAEQKKEADGKLAAMAARLHSVSGEEYGYRQTGLRDDWYQALHGMVDLLVSDCRSLGRRTRKGEKLLKYVERNQHVLEQVDCSLINFDIWPANIFCNLNAGEIHLSWIDPERCLWGDRIADFVCLDFSNMSLDSKTEMLEAYNKASENPIVVSDNERIRYAIMLGYLALIMEVEKYARYSLFNFGYWRNVVVAGQNFRTCFRLLESIASQ